MLHSQIEHNYGDGFFRLDLTSRKVTDAGLKELSGLKNLEVLLLQETMVTDAGLKELGSLTNLRSLFLPADRVKGAGFKDLAGLKNLVMIDGYKKEDFSDELLLGLGHAGLLPALNNDSGQRRKLTTLDLSGTAVTDAGLKGLAGLTDLVELDLSGTRATGAGCSGLGGLKSLKSLNLSDANVTDLGLKGVAALQSVESLDITNADVTDTGLNELAALKGLRTLNITGTANREPSGKGFRFLVSDSGVAQLQRALPTCKIIR